MTSSAVIMPRSPWPASAACTKNARFAQSGDDQPPFGVANEIDRGGKAGAEIGSKRGRYRGNAAALGIERAQRRLHGFVRVIGHG
jgi:hypothetical protein